MKIPIFALLAILFILPVPVLADNYMIAETRIGLDDTAHSALIITLDSSDSGHITVPIFGEVRNLMHDANFDDFSCTYEEKPYGYDATCDISGVKRSGSFKIEFDSFNFLEKTDGQYSLKQQISTPIDLARLNFKVILPEGTALSQDAAYLPFDGSNATDGRNIFVYWNREDVVAGEVFTVEVTYEKFWGEQNVLAAGLFALVAIFAIGAIIYRKKVSMKMVLPVLRPDEKIIMEKILEHKSGVNQKVVVRESGYSKAKVSKVLKSLEERGIVKLERLGRSNRIFLQSNFEKKA